MMEGKPTTDEDGKRCCGERDDQRRACKQGVDDPTDALADDRFPNVWVNRNQRMKTVNSAH